MTVQKEKWWGDTIVRVISDKQSLVTPPNSELEISPQNRNRDIHFIVISDKNFVVSIDQLTNPASDIRDLVLDNLW